MATLDSKARILIVEDNPPIQMLLRHLLGKHFDVDFANTVDGAIQTASQKHFDLFLLDINLGEDRTGVDLLGMLRQMPDYGTTPAIACTAYVGPQYRELFLANGFNEYVDKPFSRPGLLGAIADVLVAGKAWGHA